MKLNYEVVVITKLTMQHGTILGDANKKPVSQMQSRDALSTSFIVNAIPKPLTQLRNGELVGYLWPAISFVT